jgi:hypothetical protein
MVDFSNRAEAGRWLEEQPREVAVAIVARAALRVLPLIVHAPPGDAATFSSAIALSCFRAAAMAWVTAKYPAHGNKLRGAAAAAGADTAADVAAHVEIVARATDYPSISAHTAFSSASFAALFVAGDAARGPRPTADMVIRMAGFSAAATSSDLAHFAEMAEAATNAAEADAALIESGGSRDKSVALAAELAARPLWPGETPFWAAEPWAQLKPLLLAVDEDWEVWTEWYEDRLAGRPSDQELELARALLPDDLWQQGPKAINSEIRRLIREARNSGTALPDERSLPTLTPSAAIFVRNGSGLIDIAPPGPKDRLADTDDVRDFYLDVRAKSADLAQLGPNMLGARLSKAVLTFQDRTPEKIADAVERRVWSSGNTLRSILAAHDAVDEDRDPHPDKLDRGVTERLRDVVETFNQLALADPALRQRDARRPGPQEHDRSINEIEIVVEVTRQAASDRAITTLEAGEELAEQIDAAKETPSGLPGRLAVEFARDTHRNFFAGAMVAVYRAMRNLPEAARGERGFVSKEYFSGVYKTAGTTTVGLALSVAALAYGMRWEIVDFIISHADVLKAYAALAFEQSPGFLQMIEWLELHVISE